ncbi:MAG: aldo/keto reductase, partial [Anaerolineales bacterium]|nr:aldo/keto reductase [Anaerolineales bacterium]
RYQQDELAKSRYEQADNLTTIERVEEVAEARGIPMAQVALAWMYTKPNIAAPIVGTTKPHHLDDALAAMDVNLTDDEVERLEEPYRPHPVIAHS